MLDDITIPTVDEVWERMRVFAAQELKVTLRQELPDAPVGLLSELVGRAIGQIIAEDTRGQIGPVMSLCQQRMVQGFRNGLTMNRSTP
jgi:hypothetical protein